MSESILSINYSESFTKINSINYLYRSLSLSHDIKMKLDYDMNLDYEAKLDYEVKMDYEVKL